MYAVNKPVPTWGTEKECANSHEEITVRLDCFSRRLKGRGDSSMSAGVGLPAVQPAFLPQWRANYNHPYAGFTLSGQRIYTL